MALSPPTPTEGASPDSCIKYRSSPALFSPSDIDVAFAAATHVDTLTLQVGVLHVAFALLANELTSLQPRNMTAPSCCLTVSAALRSRLRLLPQQPRILMETFERHLAQLEGTLAVSSAKQTSYVIVELTTRNSPL